MTIGPLSVILLGGSYAALLGLLTLLRQRPTHSLTVRFLSGILSWCFAAGAAGYVYALAATAYEWMTVNPYAGLSFFSAMVFTGIVLYIFQRVKEHLLAGEMRNFILESLRFANYHRRRAHEIQEELDAERTREVYREVTGHEPEPGIASVPWEEPVRFRLTTERRTVTSAIETAHGEHLARLSGGAAEDVTETFRFELGRLTSATPLRQVTAARIDPGARVLSLVLLLPDVPKTDLREPPAQRALTGRMYTALHVLFSLPWCAPYLPFVDHAEVTVQRESLNEWARPSFPTAAEMRWDVRALLRRGGQVTDDADLRRLSAVRFTGIA